jgi:lysozyme
MVVSSTRFDTTTAKKLIKEFEGCRLKVYHCTAGKATIGYGHLCKEDQAPITQAEAEMLLDEDIKIRAKDLSKMLKSVSLLVTNNEFSAMLSLMFNIGTEAFKNSTLLRLFLAGEIDGAADEFLKWKFVQGKEEKGLLRRRKKERLIFLD